MRLLCLSFPCTFEYRYIHIPNMSVSLQIFSGPGAQSQIDTFNTLITLTKYCKPISYFLRNTFVHSLFFEDLHHNSGFGKETCGFSLSAIGRVLH